MAEPASDHRDVNTGRNQMHRRRMTEAMRCYILRRQARRDLRCCFDVLRQFKADTRCAERDTISINEDGLVAGRGSRAVSSSGCCCSSTSDDRWLRSARFP